MHFHRIAPALPLHELVQSFWEIEQCYQRPVRERILPKGTVELMFHLGGRATRGAALALPRCFLNGFNIQPMAVDLSDTHHLFGVILQPAAVRALFRAPATDFNDQCLDMTLLDAAYGRLWQQLGEASGFAERMTLCGAWLQARSNGLTPRERALNHFLSDSRDVDITVSKLSAQLCYSSRQLARQLRALTGRNTEETLLFRKYLHALDRVHRSDESLTGIAYASGFSDQAHFIRTFRACTGMTPGAYRRQRSHLAGHLFEDVR